MSRKKGKKLTLFTLSDYGIEFYQKHKDLIDLYSDKDAPRDLTNSETREKDVLLNKLSFFLLSFITIIDHETSRVDNEFNRAILQGIYDVAYEEALKDLLAYAEEKEKTENYK